VNERETFEQLVDRYGPVRARHLLGALRVLALYGEKEVRRRNWISVQGMKALRRDLRLAGVPWPSPGEDREATRAGE
jgi:hypothetical protein